ncbi:hypothetical protein B0H14DRAFT_3135740 [Mycena olivaceomarginata]|nr:hypothetical protein B0H14DRAFT_3135740 [Mycena olivaceomarginata]
MTRPTSSRSSWMPPPIAPSKKQSVPSVVRGFLYPRLAEYAVSGRPVAWDTAVDIHSVLDKHFEMFASTLEEVVKKKSTNGPSSSMFLAPRRPVFIANATAMDEGRLSEFDDVYGLLALVNDPDVRFNRVPEVLVFNAANKEYFPMSFHLLHRLGTGVVLNVTIAPMAYEHSRKLGWEYRLINITVVGCREDDALSSPSKYVVKRKAVILDLDNSSDETPVSKNSLRGARPVRAKTLLQAGEGRGRRKQQHLTTSTPTTAPRKRPSRHYFLNKCHCSGAYPPVCRLNVKSCTSENYL